MTLKVSVGDLNCPRDAPYDLSPSSHPSMSVIDTVTRSGFWAGLLRKNPATTKERFEFVSSKPIDWATYGWMGKRIPLPLRSDLHVLVVVGDHGKVVLEPQAVPR